MHSLVSFDFVALVVALVQPADRGNLDAFVPLLLLDSCSLHSRYIFWRFEVVAARQNLMFPAAAAFCPGRRGLARCSRSVGYLDAVLVCLYYDAYHAQFSNPAVTRFLVRANIEEAEQVVLRRISRLPTTYYQH